MKCFPSPRGDGNCWFRAIADQAVLHDLAYVPRNHLELRRAVIEFIRTHPMLEVWMENAVGFTLHEVDKKGNPIIQQETKEERRMRRQRNEEEMRNFLQRHSVSQTWTDDSGLICQVD